MNSTQDTPVVSITLNRVLNIREVQRLNSLSRASIYRGVAAGTFPAPIPLTPGGRRVGWREGDLREWLSDPLSWRSTRTSKTDSSELAEASAKQVRTSTEEVAARPVVKERHFTGRYSEPENASALHTAT